MKIEVMGEKKWQGQNRRNHQLSQKSKLTPGQKWEGRLGGEWKK